MQASSIKYLSQIGLTLFFGKKNTSTSSQIKLIKNSLANISIFQDKNLVVIFTWSFCLIANDFVDANSLAEKSTYIFVVLDFKTLAIFSEVFYVPSWNLLNLDLILFHFARSISQLHTQDFQGLGEEIACYISLQPLLSTDLYQKNQNVFY